MKYAKLINGTPDFAPNPILHAGLWYGNPPGEIYEAEGYKPIRHTEPPTVQPGYIAVPGWDEEEDEIAQVWSIEEEPDEVDDERAMEILFGGDG
jgi:hypothetical protein